MNLADFLTDTSNRIPDHQAILYEGNSITFAEMSRKVDALCRRFSRSGLKPGDVCIQMMPSSLNWALVYYALAKMGAVVVPVNFLFRQRELDYIFRDSGARAFIGHHDYLNDAVPALNAHPAVAIRIAEGENMPTGFTQLKDLFDGDGDFPTYPTKDDDPFLAGRHDRVRSVCRFRPLKSKLWTKMIRMLLLAKSVNSASRDQRS